MTPAEKPRKKRRVGAFGEKSNGTAYAGGYTGKQCQKKWNKYLL